GDLIMGKDNRSAIGTLVERTTRFCLLLHLPGGKDAATVADEMIKTIQRLPAELRRSLAWDQGTEMAQHARITLATDLDIYFCDPHAPWQRGSNENTNGLLRQYFPKGIDLATHSREDLARVAAELNGRPRKTLDWDTPAERLNKLLS
ncbi:IS30 family transposase, partial [Amycolatopsis sp. lyj-90]|uniref:IS30 family transposase n=1 Tax=Amycolatopsis sp. lyj-90 TaxID=2789285 RepID=UPI00397C72E2